MIAPGTFGDPVPPGAAPVAARDRYPVADPQGLTWPLTRARWAWVAAPKPGRVIVT